MANNANTGLPTPAQIITYTDALANNLAVAASAMGYGAIGETGTTSVAINNAFVSIMGDGVSTYGLGNPTWQQNIISAMQGAIGMERYDYMMVRQSYLMQYLDTSVLAKLPSGWSFKGQQPFDAWLSYLNGANSNVPSTPPAAGTLTATQNVGGVLPDTIAANGPYVCHCLVGSSSQYVSLPTAAATQVAITAANGNNAYTYQIAGTVPAGVYFVNTYRTFFGGPSTGPYMYDQQVAVTPGSAYPPITIIQGDNSLRADLQPPSWFQVAISPAAATAYAMAYATTTPGTTNQPLLYSTTNGMISPNNVALVPSNGYIGYMNPAQSAIFGSSVITGASTDTFTQGAIQTSNNSATNIQGYAGSLSGLRARTAAGFTGTATPTITYTYFDAAHGWGNIQTATGITPVSGFSTPAANATITYNVTAGRLVRSVTETSMSGTATTGAYLYEGVFNH